MVFPSVDGWVGEGRRLLSGFLEHCAEPVDPSARDVTDDRPDRPRLV